MQVYNIPIDADKKENTRHGDISLPMAIYETDPKKNILGFVNWHWHEELQFMRVLKGSVKVRLNTTEFLLNTGDGAFINTGVLHTIKSASETECLYLCLDVNPAILGGFSGSLLEQSCVRPYLRDPDFACELLPHSDPENRGMLDLLTEIDTLYHLDQPRRALDLQIRLLQLWRQLLDHHYGEQSEPAVFRKDANEDRIKAMLTLIHTGYPEKLTLEDFSAAAHLSRSECCRFFKQHVGMTIFDYLTSCRLEQSIRALAESDDSVSTIAMNCGFGSSSYYIGCFKKKTGMTPLAWRKKNAKP